MLWPLFLLLGHPLSALICGLRSWRHNADILGPVALGFFSGWGAIPLVWLVTREKRPVLHAGGLGLNPAEVTDEAGHWEAWRNYYFNLRQRLVLVSMLLLVLALGAVELFAIGYWMEFRAAWAASWLLGWLGPFFVGVWLQSGYRVPWLGKVWRHCDRIWLLSGQELPGEVRYRAPMASDSTELLEEQLQLEAAMGRHQKVVNGFCVVSFLTLVLGLAYAVYGFLQLRAVLGRG